MPRKGRENYRRWFPFYCGDYLTDTSYFTPAQHGSYLLLLIYYWCNGRLPNDENYIRKIAKCHPAHWSRSMRDALAAKFTVTYDLEANTVTWLHERVELELAEAIANKGKFSKPLVLGDSASSQVIENTQPADRTPPLPLRKKERSSSNNSEVRAENNLKLNGKRNGHKPDHGQRSPRGRIWLDRGTMEFEAHAADYRTAHFGTDPPLNWNGTGAWFFIAGEQA